MEFVVGKPEHSDVTVITGFEGDPIPEGLTLDGTTFAKDEMTLVHRMNGTSVEKIMIVGLGKTSQFTIDRWRAVCGQIGRAANRQKLAKISLGIPQLERITPEDIAQATAEGFMLGTYSFDKYSEKKTNRTLETVYLCFTGAYEYSTIQEAVTTGKVYASANNLARDLANEPPNKLRPLTLANFVKEHFAGTDAAVEISQGDALEEHQFAGLLAVGKGSAYAPAMVQITYVTDPTLPKVALIGKGITFDTGGISLKTARNISDMRMDMAGAAAVIGALDALVRLNTKCNVVGLLAVAENTPGGHSMLPGEVIEYPNRVTVQVGNTDAEGRLVLADALILANKLGAKVAIDIATLTGACASALGLKIAGVFGDDDIFAKLRTISHQTGEKIWQLPLETEYEPLLKSSYADICNVSDGPYGGAITAALFLQKFVGEGIRWAHIDMAGPMDVNVTKGYHVEGATGFGSRILAKFAGSYRE